MKALRIVHRGSVNADGFLLSGSESEMRQRALKLYQKGMRVYRHDSHMIVLLESPFMVDTHNAPGIPLVRMMDRYLGAPPDEKSIHRLPPGSISYYRGGQLQIIESSLMNRETEEDLLEWLDLSQLTYRKTFAPVTVEQPEAVKSRSDSRDTLDIPAASSELTNVLQRMKERSLEHAEKKAKSRPGFPWLPGFGRATVQISHSLWRRLLQFLPSLPAISQDNRSNAKRSLAGTNSQKSIFSRVTAHVKRWLVRIDVMNLIGWRQSAYMQKVLDMFERGDIQEALRHAPGLAALSEAFEPALKFSPRSDLKITDGKSATGVYYIDHFMGQFRDHYRRAAERLEMQNKVKEAAFVLAELMGDAAGAVGLLEKHKLFREGAELAEMRNLEGGLIVRLYFQAGDREQAIRIAILRNAFADALIRLDAADPEAARELRSVQAERLFQSGHYADATDVYQILGDTERMLESITMGLEMGGPARIRALVRNLVYFNEDRDVEACLHSDEGTGLVRELLTFKNTDNIKYTHYLREAARLAAGGLLDVPL